MTTTVIAQLGLGPGKENPGCVWSFGAEKSKLSPAQVEDQA